MIGNEIVECHLRSRMDGKVSVEKRWRARCMIASFPVATILLSGSAGVSLLSRHNGWMFKLGDDRYAGEKVVSFVGDDCEGAEGSGVG